MCEYIPALDRSFAIAGDVWQGTADAPVNPFPTGGQTGMMPTGEKGYFQGHSIVAEVDLVHKHIHPFACDLCGDISDRLCV